MSVFYGVQGLLAPGIVVCGLGRLIGIRRVAPTLERSALARSRPPRASPEASLRLVVR
jgi:hypothetical protein